MSVIILMDLSLHVSWSFCLTSFNVSCLLYIFIILTIIWCVVSFLVLFGILCVYCVWMGIYFPRFGHFSPITLLKNIGHAFGMKCFSFFYTQNSQFFPWCPHGLSCSVHCFKFIIDHSTMWSDPSTLSSGLTVCPPRVSLLMVPSSESLIWLIEFFTFYHHFSLAIFSRSIFFSIFTLFIRK